MPAWVVKAAPGGALGPGGRPLPCHLLVVELLRTMTSPGGHRRRSPEASVPQVWDMVRMSHADNSDHLGERRENPEKDKDYKSCEARDITPGEVSSLAALPCGQPTLASQALLLTASSSCGCIIQVLVQHWLGVKALECVHSRSFQNGQVPAPQFELTAHSVRLAQRKAPLCGPSGMGLSVLLLAGCDVAGQDAPGARHEGQRGSRQARSRPARECQDRPHQEPGSPSTEPAPRRGQLPGGHGTWRCIPHRVALSPGPRSMQVLLLQLCAIFTFLEHQGGEDLGMLRG